MGVILIVLSAFSLFGWMFFLSFIISSFPNVSAMEGMYYIIQYAWTAWIFAIIPVCSILYGRYINKRGNPKKGNIIVGAIFAVLLGVYGCFSPIFMRLYSTDIAHLQTLESDLKIDFPNQGTIISQDWTKGEQTSSDENYYKIKSVVRFQDGEAYTSFVQRLDEDKWCTSTETFFPLIPMLDQMEGADCDYHLLYCYEKDSFCETEAVSNYNYIYIALDVEENVMYITEFFKK